MKGFIRTSLATACLASGLALAGGCDAYRNIVDPCYPQRYEAQAQQEVQEALAPQVHDGHVLQQTVWNYHFEAGSDKLTAGGMDFLSSLARRRPAPDPVVFLQTAQDVRYDLAAPDKFAAQRADLDTRRVQAVQKYLTAETAGRHLVFEVIPHDPTDPGISSTPANLTMQKMYAGSQGNLPSTAGAGAVNVAGGAGAAGGGGAPPGTGGGR